MRRILEKDPGSHYQAKDWITKPSCAWLNSFGIINRYLNLLLSLKFFETNAFPLRCRWSISSEQQRSLHRGDDSTSDEAVEPVVVGLFGAGFSFVDGSALAFGADELFGVNVTATNQILLTVLSQQITVSNGL